MPSAMPNVPGGNPIADGGIPPLTPAQTPSVTQLAGYGVNPNDVKPVIPKNPLQTTTEANLGGQVESLADFAARKGLPLSPATAKLYNQGLADLNTAKNSATAAAHQPPAYIGQNAPQAAATETASPKDIAPLAAPIPAKEIQPINAPGPEPVITPAPEQPKEGDFGSWLAGIGKQGGSFLNALGRIAQAYTAGASAGAAGRPEEGFGMTIAGREQAQRNAQEALDNQRIGLDNNYRLQTLMLNQNNTISAAERAQRQNQIDNEYEIAKGNLEVAKRNAGLGVNQKKNELYNSMIGNLGGQ